jgi:hypothetical protein
LSELLLQSVRGGREAEVRCIDGERPKLVGRFTAEGVHFWCPCHREEVIVGWQEVAQTHRRIERLALSVAEVSVVVATLTRMR